MGSYQGQVCHSLEFLIQSEAAIACLPHCSEHLCGKNVLTRLFPNWVTFSAFQTGTLCPDLPGRNAQLLWDAMPNFCGTPCPGLPGRNAHLLWDAMPSFCGTQCPCVPFSTDEIPEKTLKVDISASISIPLLKSENHFSASMPNIFLSQKETCPGKGVPAVLSSAALDSVLAV